MIMHKCFQKVIGQKVIVTGQYLSNYIHYDVKNHNLNQRKLQVKLV